jgi:hypothetical protein
MASNNPWVRFKKLLQTVSRYRATIIMVDSIRGTCLVELTGGERLRVIGTGYEAGQIVMVEDNKIVSTLPSLPFARVEV